MQKRATLHRLGPVAAVLTASAALAACGSSASPSTTSTPTATATQAVTASAGAPVSSAKVAIRNYMFMPMNVSVKAGAKVTFTNFDSTAHTATSIDSGFDTTTLRPGQSRTVTLSKPGTYAYHCLFHAFMTAHITVVR
jgi:plastocyanin